MGTAWMQYSCRWNVLSTRGTINNKGVNCTHVGVSLGICKKDQIVGIWCHLASLDMRELQSVYG